MIFRLHLTRACSRSQPKHSPRVSRYLSSIVGANEHERKHVTVGSTGTIALDIFQPLSHAQPDGIIITFPRGPIPFAQPITLEPTSFQSLADAAHSTVVRINYRLSGQGNERYPLPIHDVAAGWSWITTNLAKRPSRANGHNSSPVGVCGEFVGGSLAAMLALTECYAPPLTGIKAAYLGNPIADWTMMGPTNKPSMPTQEGPRDVSASGLAGSRPGTQARGQAKKRKQTPLSSWLMHSHSPVLPAKGLLSLRRKVFANPSYYPDPFASPLLFFRTPASEEVSAEAEAEDMFEMVMATETDSGYGSDGGSETAGSVSSSSSKQQKDQAIRRSYRRWPPLRSGMRLPQMQIQVGTVSPLRDMGAELASCVRRSVWLYEEEKGLRPSGQERAVVEEREGLGAWDEGELERMGLWFREQFRND